MRAQQRQINNIIRERKKKVPTSRRSTLITHTHTHICTSFASRSSGLRKNIYFIPGHAARAHNTVKQHPKIHRLSRPSAAATVASQTYYLHCVVVVLSPNTAHRHSCVFVCVCVWVNKTCPLLLIIITHPTFCLRRSCIFLRLLAAAMIVVSVAYTKLTFCSVRCTKAISLKYMFTCVCVCCNEFDIDMFLLLQCCARAINTRPARTTHVFYFDQKITCVRYSAMCIYLIYEALTTACSVCQNGTV